jgi:hypothetical protein
MSEIATWKAVQNIMLQSGTELGSVGHPCNPSTWEAETEGSRVQDQPGLHNETLSQTNSSTNFML